MKIQFHKSIVAKLAMLISICLVITISINSWQNGFMFYEILNKQLQDNTVSRAKQVATTIEGAINGFRGQIIVAMQNIASLSPDKYRSTADIFVKSNKDFAGFSLVKFDGKNEPESLVDSSFLNPNEMRLEKFSTQDASAKLRSVIIKEVKLRAANNPDEVISNLSKQMDLPLLMIGIPFSLQSENGKVWAVLTIWQSQIAGLLPKSDTITSLIFDKSARLVSASGLNSLNSQKHKESPIVKMAMQGSSPFGFKGWTDKNGTPWLGAFSQINTKGLTAVVYTDGSASYQSTKKLIIRSALWTMLLVLIGVMLAWITASKVSRKLIEISSATQQIAQGNFDVKISVAADDEIGALATSVENMSFQIVSLLGDKVEKARMERELETATTIQNTFFAKSNYNSEHLKICSKFKPASECGGDWWGHFPINDRLHLICIADATGHGVPAALITAIAYSASTLLATFYSKGGGFEGSMAGILTELNRLLCRLGEGNMTLTFFAGLIDVENEKIIISNAGHNFPILVPSINDDSRFLPNQSQFIKKRNQVTLSSPGCPLGLIAEAKFEEHLVPIKQGDKILFYTDGLVECTNKANVQWGRRKLGKLLETLQSSSIEEFHNKITDESFKHFGLQPLADDVTIVSVEVGKKDSNDKPMEFDLEVPTVA